MKMIEHNHFICHLILGTFTEYPYPIQTCTNHCAPSLNKKQCLNYSIIYFHTSNFPTSEKALLFIALL